GALALGDVVEDRPLVAKLCARLIEVRDAGAGAAYDRAARRLDLAAHELQERGLAGAVGAHDADAIAAHHGEREVIDERAAADRERHVVHLEHRLAQAPGAFLHASELELLRLPERRGADDGLRPLDARLLLGRPRLRAAAEPRALAAHDVQPI